MAGIRRYLSRWDGKISIRSGTARIAIMPKWDDDVPVPLDGGDPTGCGDVLGAALVAGLLRGEPLETALARATRLAARNVSHRGASGLRDHLLGRLSTV